MLVDRSEFCAREALANPKVDPRAFAFDLAHRFATEPALQTTLSAPITLTCEPPAFISYHNIHIDLTKLLSCAC